MCIRDRLELFLIISKAGIVEIEHCAFMFNQICILFKGIRPSKQGLHFCRHHVQIKRFGDKIVASHIDGQDVYKRQLWYCYVSIATIGFGDIVAVTFIGRILTVYLSLHAILVIAIIPGIITSYYMEVVSRREKETTTLFMDKLEHLPELSKEELQEIADKIKKLK